MGGVREAWTDERLDDLAAHMDRGFERMDSDIRDLHSEMSGRFNAMEDRFAAMQRTMVVGFAAVTGSVVASVLGAVVVNQL